MEKKITTPLTQEQVKDLKCGDSVRISGVIYTARDEMCIRDSRKSICITTEKISIFRI